MIKILFSLAAVVVAGGVLFFYTQPTYDSARVFESSIKSYDQALNKAAELQSLKQSLLSQYNAFNPADLDRLHKLLPDHVDNVRLILDLDNLAGRHGMSLQNISFSGPAEESERSVIGAIGAGKQKSNSLTLKFTTQGTYTSFRALLRDLERSLRIVDLVSLGLAGGGQPSVGKERVYQFNITVRTYWLK